MWNYKDVSYSLNNLVSIFFIYSILGWVYETILVSVRNKSFVNRGFLNGPMIPIYGVGATIVTMLLSQYRNNATIIFVAGMILATTLEYGTSFIMEKIFHAKWWDYSEHRCNLKGRICLEVSVLWGGLSLFTVKLMNPILYHIIQLIPKKMNSFVSYILLILFIVDFVLTFVSTIKLDKKLENIQKLRLEISEYIAGIKLFETRENVKVRFEKYKISDIFDAMKVKLDYETKKLTNHNKMKEGMELKFKKEEIELKLNDFRKRYQKHTEKIQKIQFRLLKAFPNVRFTNKESALKDLKDKLHKK